tara:strand:+ start:831 stop:1496 length:666 start_codon:yes stop_codon:yes gene_type:complete
MYAKNSYLTEKLILKFSFVILIIFSSNPMLSHDQRDAVDKKETLETESQMLNQTCLDEYALRNEYLRRFILYNPPTLILSLPILSKAYLIAMIGWAILPIEYLNAAILSAIVLPPAIIGTAIAFETKFTIEYFGNRFIMKVVDALRMGDSQNRFIKILLNKFREKYPQSDLTNMQIFNEILRLDKNGDLCNGHLTNSRSVKLKKHLAKKRHLLKYLSKVNP